MNPARLNAVISFYNLLSEKLSLEVCGGVADARYLLHSTVELIRTGDLVYKSHDEGGGFGYKAAVEFLHKQQERNEVEGLLAAGGELPHLLPSTYWENAEGGDEQAAAQVLLALLYELRLLRPEKFEEFASELASTDNSELAVIVKRLDDREDDWDSIFGHLKTTTAAATDPSKSPLLPVSPLASCANSTSTPLAPPSYSASQLSRLSKTLSRSFTSCTPKHPSSLSTFHPHKPSQKSSSKREQRRHSSAASAFWHVYPESPEARLAVVDEYANSPVSYVLHSPRGSDVSRLRQQQRQIAELKEQIEQMGRERDRCEEKQRLLKEGLAEMREDKRAVEQRLATMRCQLEQQGQLQERVNDLHAENERLVTEVHRLETELDEYRLRQGHMAADCEESTRRLAAAKHELASVNESNKVLRRNLADEVQLHTATREQVAIKEEESARLDTQLRRRVEDLENELREERRAAGERKVAKEREFQSRLALASQVQSGYAKAIGELEGRLATAEDEKHSLHAEIDKLREESAQLEARLQVNLSTLAAKDDRLRALQSDIASWRERSISELARNAELDRCNSELRAGLRDNEFVTEYLRCFVAAVCQSQPSASAPPPTRAMPGTIASTGGRKVRRGLHAGDCIPELDFDEQSFSMTSTALSAISSRSGSPSFSSSLAPSSPFSSKLMRNDELNRYNSAAAPAKKCRIDRQAIITTPPQSLFDKHREWNQEREPVLLFQCSLPSNGEEEPAQRMMMEETLKSGKEMISVADGSANIVVDFPLRPKRVAFACLENK